MMMMALVKQRNFNFNFRRIYLYFLIALRMLYSFTKFLLSYIISLYYRKINVQKVENVPKKGAVIIFSNHPNNITDGAQVKTNISRPVSSLVAESTYKNRVAALLLWASDNIPINRPQDNSQTGKGRIIKIQNNILIGQNTFFSTIPQGSSLQFLKFPEIHIIKIISNQQVIIDRPQIQFQGEESFKIIPKQNYNKVYNKVWQSLKEGKCISIFPQGKSHDRLELLPLKAGICIKALGAIDKFNIDVTLVPCLFNYEAPKQFRSQINLQFGKAYKIPSQVIKLYKTDKKKAISILLPQIQKMLKSKMVEFKYYLQKDAMYLSRLLYEKSCKRQITNQQRLELNRRFARGYEYIVQNQQFRGLHQRILDFTVDYKKYGLKIQKQMSGSHNDNGIVNCIWLLGSIIRYVFFFVLILPEMIIYGPSMLLINYMAQKQRKRGLKASKTKIQGYDVVASYKMLLLCIFGPLSNILYAIIIYFLLPSYFDLKKQKAQKIVYLFLILQPILTYLSTKLYDLMCDSWKQLKKPFFIIFKKDIYQQFKKKQLVLQNEIIKAIEIIGPRIFPNFTEDKRILKSSDLLQ